MLLTFETKTIQFEPNFKIRLVYVVLFVITLLGKGLNLKQANQSSHKYHLRTYEPKMKNV